VHWYHILKKRGNVYAIFVINIFREEKLVQMVKERILNKDKPLTMNLYTPTNTQCRIKYFNPEKAITLKSAKKVPILIPFYVKERKYGVDIGQDEDDNQVVDFENPDLIGLSKQPCIFKMGDDCRQDQLALQIISMFKRIFENLNLPLYLYPYRVITTGRGMGIIECVPNTMSRHQLGVYTEGDLYDYFIKKYGHENSIEFQIARKNFIESMAAYSVVSYILNIKDRHNGNILVDEDGHIVHIDFGFIFDTTPGGNYGIERQVPFKLTTEMLLIMGERFDKRDTNVETPVVTSLTTDGDMKPVVHVTYDAKEQQHAEPFNLFVDLVVRGFLASRDHMHSIISIVEVMLQSELPCFTKDAIKNLKMRFCADKSEKEAVKFIKEKIESSYKNMFSVIYDQYQRRFEGVNC
jgi:phosphatidylinositol 4-kinase